MKRAFILLFVLSAVGCSAYGQSDGYLASSNTRGPAPLNTFMSADIDHINLANGALNLKIPLYSRQGRGLNTEASLNYSSKFWIQIPNFNVSGGLDSILWRRSNTLDFTVETSEAGYLDYNEDQYDCQFTQKNPDGTYTTYNYTETVNSAFIYRASDGSSHRFPNAHTDLTPNYGNRTCSTPATNDQGPSDDGSMWLDTSHHPYTLYHKDGSQECVDQFYPCSSPAVLTDTNGNFITGQLDTIGRAYSWSNSPGSLNGSIQDSNGNEENYTFNTQNGTGSANTQFPTTSELGIPVVQSTACLGCTRTLTLADGLSYVFSFDPVFGEVTKVVLPTGGYIRYEYVTLAAVDNIPDFRYNTCCIPIDSRRISARHTSATGNAADEQNTYYSYSPSTNTTTVTDPLGNVSVHTFSNDDSFNPAYEISASYYQGSSTLLKTVTTTWAHDLDRVLYNRVNGQNRPLSAYADWRVASVTTTLNDTNQVKQEANTYDSYTIGTVTRSRSNLISRVETDWGSGTAGSQLQQTQYAYLNDSNSTYANLHIVDRLSFKAVCGTAGCGTCTATSCTNATAQTQYEYDNYTSAISSSGAVQHSSAYGTTYITRGNVTATKAWRSTDNTWLTTRNQYDDAGNVVSTTDPLSNQTQFSYADSWVNVTCKPTGGNAAAFRTKVTDALTHVTKATYNSCSGTVATTTDANSQVVSLSYDGMDRTTQAAFPDTGQTSVCYSDWPGGSCYSSSTPIEAVLTEKIVTTAPPNPKTSTTVYDGLGRIKQTQLNSDPENVDYVDTSYDGLGHIQTKSNPYRSTLDPTYGTTTFAYAALDRPTTVTDQDTSVVTTTYSGNCANTTDEAGRQRRSCTDGLGRLIQVFEDPNGLNYETDYGYDPLNNLTGVTQKGGSTDSTTWRVRTFTYDSLSRLSSSANPESGQIAYTYDSDGNLLTKVSPAPNQTGSTTQTISYCYDALNRLKSKWYTTPTCSQSSPAANYFYDQTSYNGLTIANGIGRRTGMSDTSGATAWSFDQMGRVQTERRTINGTSGVTQNISYTYNLDGSLATVTYPSGRVISYTYGSAARLLSAVDSANNINYGTSATYAPHGGLTKLSNGSSISGALTYNNRLQPLQMYYTTGDHHLNHSEPVAAVRLPYCDSLSHEYELQLRLGHD